MVMGLELVESVIIASFILALSYFLNGYRQRQLEKRTTNYHAKLSAFQKVNAAAVGLIGGLIGLRSLLSITWEDRATDEQIFEVAWLMASAREAERPLGTEIVESISEDLKKASLKEDEDDRREALRDWADATHVSLLMLYMRVLAFHMDRLTLETSQADLVSDNTDVEEALVGFRVRAMQYIDYLTDRAGKGMPTVEELAQEIAVLDAEWDRLKSAMWAELDATL